MGQFLRAALTPFANDFRWIGHGILEWMPSEPQTSPNEIFVISAGIHGNETAPVELLDQLVEEFRQSPAGAAAPCLFLLGNIEAMQVQQRFLGTNLNRLFGPGSEAEAVVGGNTAEALEQQRARILQLAVRCFQSRFSSSTMVHLDLHTAIRRSEISKFAILPPVEQTPASSTTKLLNLLLQAAGMQACVRHQESGTTFSGWTAREFGAISATLELGQVKAFGANDLTLLNELKQTLRACCSAEARQNRTVPQAIEHFAKGHDMTRFVVHHEIVRTSEGFELHVSDDVANFHALPQGFRLYSAAGASYAIDHAEARILFPNPKVEIGHRAGLVVVPAGSATQLAQAD
ncbi:succinylglutamate desuccinylase [Allohahella sp. A8]|uniref:succinylglutamate desuccinylase n=1 Tax=Allohahella sp. A8 TaxID=3141461 RepID=UPI003A80DB4F